MPRVRLQPAYLLHRRPFRDSSQLLEVFSLDHGRLPLVARGMSRRRRGGALAALLQPFRPLLLSFAGRGEMATLTDVEPAGEAGALGGERLISALYLNELLGRLLHRHEAHPRLFAGYAQALAALADGAAVAPLLRRFEFNLLEELGYGVDLERTGGGGSALQAGRRYRLDAQLGLVDAVTAREDGSGDYCGADLLAIAEGRFDDASPGAARRLARALLDPHLGPEPLHSRALLRAARR